MEFINNVCFVIDVLFQMFWFYILCFAIGTMVTLTEINEKKALENPPNHCYVTKCLYEKS